MVDITAKLFWYRTKEWCENMADKLNDIVYTDDSKETVDVINLLLLGWILLGLVVYIIGNVIASQLRKRKSTFKVNESKTTDEKPETVEQVSCTAEQKSTDTEAICEPEKIKKIPLIPVCTGDDEEIVGWINNVFSWMYNQRVVSPVLDSWLSALNARTRLSSTEHGILVDFKDVVHSSSPPAITEVIQIYNSKGDLNIMCDTEVEDVTFEVSVTQFKEKEKIIMPFILNLKRLHGKVNVDCVPEELTFVTRFSETPQVQLSAEVAKSDTAPQDYEPLCDLICEIATEALSSSIVSLRFSCYPECPRLSQKISASEEDLFEAAEGDNEEKLLVKIIKATNLGGQKGCLKPYCVVEMDEPPQKFETQGKEETSNPFWDESCIFTVKDISAELLFEIYDKGKPSSENFLGLGIVSVDELIKNPSQRQIIPLQSRPLENDDVTGSLTTEFLFMNQTTPVSETTHLAQHNGVGDSVSNSGKTIEKNSRVTAGGTVITTTTIKRTKEGMSVIP